MRKIYVEKSIIDYLSENDLIISKSKLGGDDNDWLIYIPLPPSIDKIMILGTHSGTWSIITDNRGFVSIRCTIADNDIKYLVAANTDIDPELFVKNKDIYISYATDKKYCLVALSSSVDTKYDIVFDEMDYCEA